MYDTLMLDWKTYGEIPPAIENRPKLSSHLTTAYDAYAVLRAHRTFSENGPNPISYSDICQYADRHGISGDRFDTFLHLVQSADHAYLEYCAEVRQQEFNRMKAKNST